MTNALQIAMQYERFGRSYADADAKKRVASHLKRGILDCAASMRRQTGDSSDGQFAAQLLTAVMPRAYVHEFADLRFANGAVISHDTTLDPGAQFWGFQEVVWTGGAKIVSDAATVIPTVDLEGKWTQQRIKTIADAYRITTQDIRSSNMSGTYDAVQQRVMATRRAIDQKIEDLITSGDSEQGFVGLVNWPGINTKTAAGAWTAATPQTIVDEFNSGVNAMIDATNGVEVPNTAVFPILTFAHLATTPFAYTNGTTTTTGLTILQYLQAAHPEIDTWATSATLKTAFGGNKAVMVYNRDPMKLAVKHALPATPLQPVWQGLGYSVAMEARYGGLYVPAPKSILRFDGI